MSQEIVSSSAVSWGLLIDYGMYISSTLFSREIEMDFIVLLLFFTTEKFWVAMPDVDKLVS